MRPSARPAPASPSGRGAGDPYGARAPNDPSRAAASYGAVRSSALASGHPRRLQPSQSIEVGPDTEFGGALLRRLRESCPADIETIAEITKIRKRYLLAIEEHDFASLPAAVYVRGFVVEYARVLGLDPQRVAQSYMILYKRLISR